MTEPATPGTGTVDPYIQHLKGARESSAVLKIRLAAIKANSPSTAIFAFEGDDDKIVYCQWIRRIRPELSYEPFPCGGKKHVRDLKSLLSRDLGGLAIGVYFFVDRDFDDLVCFENAENVFMTDMHSVENYLVSRAILDDLLKHELPFHGNHQLRKDICLTFENNYREFLEITSEINYRLFVSAQLSVDLTQSLPKKINRIATVSFRSVEVSTHSADQIVTYAREPTIQDEESLRKRFANLKPRERYRGKFALMFFNRWLECLVTECASLQKGGPGQLGNSSKPRTHELTVSNFASKSKLPEGLDAFIMAVAA